MFSTMLRQAKASRKSQFLYLAHPDFFDKPMPVYARKLHVRKRVSADGICIHIHPQAFEVKRRFVALDLCVHAHCGRVADPMMLGAEWAADVRPVPAHLSFPGVNLVIVRSVGED